MTPKTLSDLLSWVRAVERRKRRRYGELSLRAAEAGNQEAAGAFAELDQVTRLPLGWDENGTVDDGDLPDLLTDREIDNAGGVYLLTPHQCFQLASLVEKRLQDDYVNLSSNAPDADFRLAVEKLIKEKMETRVQIRLRQKQIHRSQCQPELSHDVSGVTDMESFRDFLLGRLEGAWANASAQADHFEQKGEASAAQAFRQIAQRKKDLAGADFNLSERDNGDIVLHDVAEDAFRCAFQGAEKDYQAFMDIAETTDDGEVQITAQDYASLAISDISSFKKVLDEQG